MIENFILSKAGFGFYKMVLQCFEVRIAWLRCFFLFKEPGYSGMPLSYFCFNEVKSPIRFICHTTKVMKAGIRTSKPIKTHLFVT